MLLVVLGQSSPRLSFKSQEDSNCKSNHLLQFFPRGNPCENFPLKKNKEERSEINMNRDNSLKETSKFSEQSQLPVINGKASDRSGIFPLYKGLSALIKKSVQDGLMQGVAICNGAPKLSHLFFADDSLIFCKATLAECDSLQHVLKVYEEVSGQQSNRAKTSLFFSSNTKNDVKQEIKIRFGAQIIKQHEKYLGLPSLGVSLLLFGEVSIRLRGLWKEEFDGVWVMVSVLGYGIINEFLILLHIKLILLEIHVHESLWSAYKIALEIQEANVSGSVSNGGSLRAFWKKLWKFQVLNKADSNCISSHLLQFFPNGNPCENFPLKKNKEERSVINMNRDSSLKATSKFSEQSQLPVINGYRPIIAAIKDNMDSNAFAPMDGGTASELPDTNSWKQPFDAQRYFSHSESD
ncbi:hypothetical protein SO802_000342 [Lithocarpus litseifolius]|uniref:Reverse transcriptase domain-containing protein n=1 Tax=Lithocarpus litseifolius TaxID=425828 RepID=A0AAW2DUR0_9ROSI